MPESGFGWDAPDTDEKSVDWSWLHVGGGDPRHLIVLSDSALWYIGHWNAGRMVRCAGQQCDLCRQSLGRRRRWLIWVEDEQTTRRYVWEFSDAIAEQFRAAAAKYGSLRGLTFDTWRDSWEGQSRIHVSVTGYAQVLEIQYVDLPALSTVLDSVQLPVY
jgi:hypothetical protein